MLRLNGTRLVAGLAAVLYLSTTVADGQVISQIYGGAGCGTANCSTYQNDFVEIFNPTTSPVTMTNWSVQYASATGTTWAVTAIPSATIAPGGYLLVSGAFSANGIAPLPTADISGTTAMSATAGKVALVNSTTALTGSGCPIGATVVDFVGYGTTANCNEGGANTAAPSTTTAVFRRLNGCQDTNNNGTDFILGADLGVRPRNSSSPLNICAGGLSETRVDTGTGGATADGTLGTNEYGPGNSYFYRGDGIGFAGMIGFASNISPVRGVYMNSDSSNLYVALRLGADLGSNDCVVIYLDTKAGGFNDATMSDTADLSRSAITNLGVAGNETFPTGFLADYAIAINTFGVFAFECTSGSLNFLSGNTTSGTGLLATTLREIQIPYSNLGGFTAGSDVKFFVALVNGSSGFLSNESNPPSPPLNSVVNPGTSLTGTYSTFDRFTTETPCTPPSIGGQPTSASVCAGGSAGFTVTASGTAPLSYQWRKYPGPVNVSDGGGISGSGTATISFNPAAVGHAGTYDCLVTNACGSATSNQVTLTVQAAPTASAGGPYSTCELAAVNISGTAGNAASTLWTTSGTGTFGSASSLSTTYTPSGADLTAGSVTLTLTASPIAPCATPATSNATLTIQAAPTANAGGPYSTCGQAAVSLASATASGDSGVSWSSTGTGTFTPNNTTLAATYNPSAGDVTAGTVTLTLTASPIAPCSTPATSNATLTLQAPPTANAGPDQTICGGTATMAGSSSNTTGCTWMTAGDGAFDDASLSNAVYTPGATDITNGSVVLTYTCGAIAPCSTAASDTMTLTIGTVPATPSISLSPDPICIGQAGTLTATVGGGETADWYDTACPTGGNLLLAGSLTLPITATPSATYYARARNTTTGCLSAACASITVSGESPAVVNAGADQTICSTSTVSLSGSSTISNHTWSTSGDGTFDNVNALNAVYTPGTNDIATELVSLTLTSVNSCGTVSDVMQVSIHSPIAIAPQPVGGTAGVGSSFNFTVGATGGGLSYQWRKYPGPVNVVNGGNISGALTNSLTINPVGVGDAGTYDCLVTNACGSLASSTAVLNVSTGATVSLVPTETCIDGNKLTVEINLSSAPATIVGGQFFLAYNTTYLTLLTADPGDAPFTREVYECSTVTPPTSLCVPAAGIIDYAVGIPDGGTGTSANTTMARLSFSIAANLCTPTAGLVWWRASGPNGAINQLSDDNGDSVSINPVDLTAIKIDNTAPVLTGCPPTTLTLECGATAPTYTVTANDNCDGTVTVSYSETTPVAGTCPVKSTYTRTWTAVDACGNTASCQQVVTVQDTTGPVLGGCPAAPVTIECGDSPPSYAVTAEDACDGTRPVTYSESAQTPGTCPVKYTYTRTWTSTDVCGNSSSCSQLVTVRDMTAPVLTGCPLPTASYQCYSAVPAAATVTANDACDGSVSVNFSETQTNPGSSCNNVITRTWTAVDACGNTSSCTQIITVNDTTAPVLSDCPTDPVTIECGSSPPAFNVTANDNCDGSLTVNYSESVQTPGTCPVKYTYTRTWTATDSCNNTASCSQVVTVQDTVGPVLTGCPLPTASYQCYSAVPAAATVTANDACDGSVTVTPSETQTNPGSSCNNVITRTWTAVDACGNTSSCTQIITVNDTQAPVLSDCPTGPVTIECGSSPPAFNVTANDNCDGSLTVNYSESAQTPGTCPVKYTYTRTWTATDSCNNTASCSQVVTVQDTVGPVLTGCPSPTASYQCYSAVPAAATVTANDACDGSVTVTPSETQTNPGSSCNNVITRTWTAVDACGNTSSCTQIITVNDTQAPTFTCPSNMTLTPLAGSCTVNPTLSLPDVADNCDPAPTVTFTPAGPYGPGTTTVTAKAKDACNNESSCTFDITVNSYNVVDVDVELGGGVMAAGPYDRCITFEFWNGASMTYSTSQTYNFSSGNIPAQTLNIPCGTYTCVTARDRLHTLRRTINLVTGGPSYSANFTGAKKLIGGNLNDDKFIDILDFGIYTIYDLTAVNPNSDCSIVPPTRHANINGDALVNSLDFGFISNNFLQVREANCDGNPNTITASDNSPGGNYGPTPITSITVAELAQRGMPELAAVDLNRDGVLNQTDISLWMQGVRPTQNPGGSGRPGSGGPMRPVDNRPIGIGGGAAGR